MATLLKRISSIKIVNLYLGVISSIAFFPTLIALGLFGIALLTLYWDQHTSGHLFGISFEKNIINPDSARSLLSAIAGGIITLMVFSFSMVMVILNQTSSSFSPRLLPGLVSQRSNQIVLGFYLGTIAYTFTILSSIQSKIYQFQIPSLAIVINAVLALVCLGMFISFIHAISQTIQIGNLVIRISKNTLEALSYEIHKKVYVPDEQLPDMQHWVTLKSHVSGYFYRIEQKRLLRIAKEWDVCIKLMIPLGMFVNKRDILFMCSRPISEEEHLEIVDTFVFHHQEKVTQNYVHGFKQLSEIAIKALSPGINDPGTAVQALNQLTDLFNCRLEVYGYNIVTDEAHHLRIIYEPVPIDTLFYFSFSSIKNYATADIPVMHTLFLMISSLIRNDTSQKHTNLWLKAVNDLIETYGPALHTYTDKESMAKMVYNIIQNFPDHPESAFAKEKLAALTV